tara:strand:+ start:1299 stop:2282 length:984 start_codon:yes stop_codon:yes gene_type:complete
MTKLFLHIGLGKAASSKLQRDIFPYIAKFLNFEYAGNENIPYSDLEIENKVKVTKHCHNMLFGKDTKEIIFNNKIIISNEGLSSYREPQFYEEFAEKNLKAFGDNAHVILVIRKPTDFLNSIYVQACIHEKPFQDPESFFVNKDQYTERLPNAAFLINSFDYNQLISFYSKKFNKFSIIKFEELNKMEWAKEIFKLDESQIKLLKHKFTENTLNKSAGIHSGNFIKNLSKILRLFSFDYKNKYSNSIILQRFKEEEIKNEYEVRKNISFIKKLIIKFNSFINKPYIVDRIFGYKKIFINLKTIEGLDIEKLEEIYLNLPDFKTFTRD